MSNGLNLALVIRGDASGAKQAAAETRAAVNDTRTEADRGAAAIQAANDQAAASARRVTEALTGQAQAQRNLQAAVASFAGVRSPANDDAYKQRALDVAAYGASLDNLRARYNPLFAAELAHIRNLAEIDRALKVGAIGEDEHAAAVKRAASSYELQRAGLDSVAGAALAAKLQLEEYSRQAVVARQQQAADRAQLQVNQLLGVRDPSAMAGSARTSAEVFLKEGAEGAALATHEMTNLTYQMNDIAMMLASGQSPFVLMMQQGAQVSQIMGQRGLGQILPAIGSALAKLISPTTILLAGVTAAGYAAYAAYRLITPEVKSLDEVLKDHEAAVKNVGEAYGIMGEKAKGAFAFNGRNSVGLDITANLNDLRLTLKAASQGNLSDLLIDRGGGGSGNQFGPAQVVRGAYSEFADAIEHLRKTAKEGQPDVIGFKKMVEDRWALDPNNQALTETAQKLREMVGDSLAAARALKELEEAKRKLDASVGPGGIPLRRGLLSTEDTGSYGLYTAAQRVEMNRMRAGQDAELSGLYARSPAERAAAARERAASTYSDESAPIRSLRIEQAGAMELARAYHELNEAQRQRLRSLDDTIASARLDVELVGKSAGETARLRMEHELLAQVRAAAADAGVEADQAEIARIREKAAEYGRLVAIQQAADAIRGQIDDIARLKLETLLIGQSDSVRERAIARMENELDIRRLGIDLYGEQAEMMRRNTEISADLTEELRKQSDAWGLISDTAQSGIDRLVDSAANGFRDIDDALGDIGKDLIKSSLQLTVANPLKNWLTGSDLPEMGDLKNMGGALGRLFGKSPTDPASAVASVLGANSTAMMNVTAGTVVINGGVGGGSGGLLGQLLGNVANDNGLNDNYAPGAVTRAPLGPVSDMAAYIRQAAVARNIDPDVALKVARSEGLADGIWQSNVFKNGLREPSYGPFQLLKGGAGTGFPAGLGNAFQRTTGLDPANPANARAGVNFALDHASQNGWGAWYGAKAAGVGNFEGIGSAGNKAVDALNKLGSTADIANRSMTGFGGGLNQLSNALNQFPAAPALGNGGGGGGLFSGLTNLFRATSKYVPDILSGTRVGLFDGGGWTGPGPRNKPAGIVHAGEVVWSQDDVNRAGGVHVVEAMRLGRPGYVEGGYVVGDGGGRPSGARAGFGGAAPSTEINIYSQDGAQVKSTKKRKNASGGDVTDIVIGVVKQSIADGDLDGAFGGRFGAQPVRARRGSL